MVLDHIIWVDDMGSFVYGEVPVPSTGIFDETCLSNDGDSFAFCFYLCSVFGGNDSP